MTENSVRISVRVDDDTAAGIMRVRASIDSMGRSMSTRMTEHGHEAGTAFSGGMSTSLMGEAESIGTHLGADIGSSAGDGVSRGVMGGISEVVSNPYVLVAGAAIGAALGGVIATIAGGAIILGLGGAFTAIAVMAVKNTAPVKKAWADASKDIKAKITDASSPLIPVLVHAAGIAQKIVDTFAPVFKSAFTDVAPQMSDFLDSLGSAVDKFKPAVKPIMEAFGSLLGQLSPAVGQVAGDLADAFTNLATTFAKKQNAKAFADLVKLILELALVSTVNGISSLADAWGRVDASLTHLSNSKAGPFLNQMLAFFKWCVGSATVGFLNNTATAINGIAAATNIGFKSFTKFSQWLQALKSKSVSLTVKGVPAAIQLVKNVIAWIKKFLGKSVTLSVKGVAAAIQAVGSLINKIKNFVGKTVTVSVKAVVSGVTNTVKKLLGLAHGGVVGASGYAHGGYVGAAAGGGPRSNRTLVGENGPEIVDLAPGSHVRSNPDSRRIMSEGGGGQKIVLEFAAPAGSIEAALFEIMRKGIRIRGGNVQTALGRN